MVKPQGSPVNPLTALNTTWGVLSECPHTPTEQVCESFHTTGLPCLDAGSCFQGHGTPSQAFKLIFNCKVSLNSKTPVRAQRMDRTVLGTSCSAPEKEGLRGSWGKSLESHLCSDQSGPQGVHDLSATTCPSLHEVPLDPECSILSEATRLQL